ncbi:MAG: outer membrane lipoprotein-sorting protein [Colwellia sp.]|jgi:Predicted exporters of the RND superfamily
MFKWTASFTSETFFRSVVKYPKTVITASLIMILIAASFTPNLVKDTSFDAFLGQDNPALIYRNKVKEMFGLVDPMVIAIVNEGEFGVYNPKTLELVSWITNEVSLLANVDPDRIFSLSTENNIRGTESGMEVEQFMEFPPISQHEASNIAKAISDFPLYLGTMSSRDGKATLVIVELIDETAAEATYAELMELMSKAPINDNEKLHVAGEGAVTGYTGSYVDSDAQMLNPIAFLIIILVITLVFKRFSPPWMSTLVILASVLITLGVMAASGVPFFLVTNVLPVILIGISVADTIHIYSHYYEVQIKKPNNDKLETLVETMVAMWKPVTFTTLTTVGGFIGLYLASYMPPFKYVGLFSALGVTVAWIYSLVFLPAAIALTKPSPGKRFTKNTNTNTKDFLSVFMVWLGSIILNHSKKILVISVLISLAGIYSASIIEVDEDRIATFHYSEPIYKADKIINKYFDGTNYLDIVVETKEIEGILNPANLNKIAALQKYVNTLPHVNGSVSIVDYLKQMNRALNKGDNDFYSIPVTKEIAAQSLLLYSMSSDPNDFEEIVDYDYRTANIRVRLDTGAFKYVKDVVEPLQSYVDENLNNTEISASLSGRVSLIYHWVKDLGESSFISLIVALLLVWIVSSLLFKSSLAGLFALLPVVVTVLFIYAIMVALNIPINTGTSMFASIAIGLGVDFTIHILSRLRLELSSEAYGENNIEDALKNIFPTTGRALMLNFLAIALGFGVLALSKATPVRDFGIIISAAITASFFASLTILPALVKLFDPKFLYNKKYRIQESNPPQTLMAKNGFIYLFFALVISSAVFFSNLSFSSKVDNIEKLPAGTWLIDQVNTVDDGPSVSRMLTMTMTDRRGKERVRTARVYRKDFDGSKKTAIFYKSPSNIKGTGLLTYDYKASDKDDDQWLYLPSMRKIRRVSASDRGDHFLGTDFTFEDIKNDGKVDSNDYKFSTVGIEYIDGVKTYRVKASPVNEATAKELGYGQKDVWINPVNWMIVKSKYWDVRLNPLKTLYVDDISKVDGIWTSHKLSINNHKTEHMTKFVFSDVTYASVVDNKTFSKRFLSKGK